MQRVKDLYEQLSGPGQQRMWLEVRKRNIAVSRQQVFDFVARQGERQVFTRPLPKAEGKTASEDVNARYMLDIVNFRENLMTVFMVNEFSRKVWARPVQNKSAEAVLAAGKQLIERLDEKPKVVSTDDGLEYSQLSTFHVPTGARDWA